MLADTLSASLALLGNHQPLRLPKKHAPDHGQTVSAEDGARLLSGQSMLRATVAGVVTIVLFAFLWVLLTRATGRVFPWATLLLGIALGRAIQRSGRGVDWRFPALAATLALAGALFSNIMVAAANTAESMGLGILDILSAVTAMTWPVFFDEALSAAAYVYAGMAAALAAFFANRKLTRAEYRALRLYRERSNGH